MKKFPNLILLIFFIFISKIVFSQDAVFSHYWVDKLYLNPALAGNDKGLSASLMQRYQWPKITSDFATYSFNISGYEPNLAGGWGISAIQNVEGEGLQKTTEVSFTYAYRIFSDKKRWDISFGLRTGYLQRSIDYSKLVFSDQIDPVNGFIYATEAELPTNNSVGVLNANVGANWRWFLNKEKRTYLNIGLSCNNITRPQFSLLNLDSRLPLRTTLYSSILIPVNPKSGRFSYSIKPVFLITRQGNSILNSDFSLIITGLQWSSENIFGGVMYRSGEVVNLERRDALFFNFGAFWNRPETIYSFSYGYEVNISKLATNTGGSHELAITMDIDSFVIFRKTNSMSRKRNKNCPDFKRSTTL
jgi:type IX secretion system PorP/SprF family membrane protein